MTERQLKNRQLCHDYYLANKKRISEYKKQWYEENKERIRLKNKAMRKDREHSEQTNHSKQTTKSQTVRTTKSKHGRKRARIDYGNASIRLAYHRGYIAGIRRAAKLHVR